MRSPSTYFVYERALGLKQARAKISWAEAMMIIITIIIIIILFRNMRIILFSKIYGHASNRMHAQISHTAQQRARYNLEVAKSRRGARHDEFRKLCN